jgi:SAM-dependent methyltransferase
MFRSRFCQQENGELSRAVAEWFAQPPGSRLLDAEREILSGMVSDLFGYGLLQLGALGDNDFLAHCPIRQQYLIGLDQSLAGGNDIAASVQQLPIASDCMDAVVIAHVLDFSADPHQVLREVERVLIPEGRVLIVGFNPFSLWGLWRLFGRWRGRVPWCGRFLSYPRINDWLSLMGFDIERTDVLEFRPPLRNARSESIERLGRQYWPMFAGVYVVRAVKRVSRVTPLREQWSRLRVLKPRVAEPSVRQANNIRQANNG